MVGDDIFKTMLMTVDSALTCVCYSSSSLSEGDGVFDLLKKIPLKSLITYIYL